MGHALQKNNIHQSLTMSAARYMYQTAVVRTKMNTASCNHNKFYYKARICAAIDTKKKCAPEKFLSFLIHCYIINNYHRYYVRHVCCCSCCCCCGSCLGCACMSGCLQNGQVELLYKISHWSTQLRWK